ncbi:MAG: hypothetical protein NWF03_04085 [Candidatus Bathyarchaeota archaeon]|nr:hypothetical protein [Candidatus Bathyarchaeota archaeon]
MDTPILWVYITVERELDSKKMKNRLILAVFFVSLLFIPLFWVIQHPNSGDSEPDFFVGVDTAYDDVEDIKVLVDKVKSYTNLFGIGSSGIAFNRTKLDDVCQYVYDNGLYFIVYKHPAPNNEIDQSEWIADAKRRWGDRFLGIYLFDESGGRQVDNNEYRFVESADNYTDAATKYVEILDESLRVYTDDELNSGDLPLFTGDYALYWFDYETRFDVVLSEFGWNHSRLLSIALNRGAAKMHDKDWGVIVTWTYWNAPYLESADELYNDLLYAYMGGAKYVIVFNYAQEKITPYGTLTEEHFDALERFWSYVKANPRSGKSDFAQVGYVLPKDYGWGFRGDEDKVWGFWLDELSTKIGTDVNYLLHTYHIGLDIIYDDPKYYDNFSQYDKLIFWNGTVT